MKTFRSLLLTNFGLVHLAMALLHVTSLSGAERPNVVLVVTDDQGYGDLGCHGNPVLQTPNIDRFSRQSVQLTRFHATPLCTTTRAALLTGRHCLRTGAWSVLGGHSMLRRNELTMPEHFSKHGYATGLFGKWHLGDNYPYRPQDRGFQEVLWHGGGGIGTTPDFWKNDYFDDTFQNRSSVQVLSGYGTDALFAAGIKFIEDHREQPFFCLIATDAPHDPWNVDPKYAQPYQTKVDANAAAFFGMIANIDENFAKLLERLDQWQLSEKTIVVFMTDNGSSGGVKVFNAGMRGGKGSPYDGGHRVPCFIRLPGETTIADRKVPELTSVTDVFPTLADACKIPLPENLQLDGFSLFSRLNGTADRANDDRLVYTGVYSGSSPSPYKQTAIIHRNWRLVNGQELYDIDEDPAQKNNLAKSRPKIVKSLRDHYESWWSTVEPTFQDQPRIVIGHPDSNPTWLTSWDLLGQVVYMQHQVEACERADGYWEIETARAGKYKIRLRRWPPEVDRPIVDGLKVLRITKEGKAASSFEGADLARLLIGGQDLALPFDPQANEVVFEVELTKGPTRLQAWFINTQVLGGATWSPYYVGCEFL